MFVDCRKYKCKNFTLEPSNNFETFYVLFQKERIGYVKMRVHNKYLSKTIKKFEFLIFSFIDTSYQGTIMMKHTADNNWRLDRVVIINAPMKILNHRIILIEKCI